MEEAPVIPEVFNVVFEDIETFDIITAQRMYDYLLYKLNGYQSIERTPDPKFYLRYPERYKQEWDELVESVENSPPDYRKLVLNNPISHYMKYMHGVADTLNYI